MLLTTYILLGLSICAVWAPNISLGGGRSVKPWVLLFAAAIISGLSSGVLTWHALMPLAVLFAASLLSQRFSGLVSRTVFTLIAAGTALALALHAVPGFNNAIVVDRALVSVNAVPFTQYANFDKGAAGLILLAFFCQRITSATDARRIVVPTLMVIGLTTLAVVVYGLSAHYLELDPKVPTFALAFLGVNLLFTCVAEEAFFRGLFQERLMRVLAARWQWVAIAVSSVLFGIAHFAGGLEYVVLATIAGVGYSLAYATTRRIEPAIVTHFSVNAIHFFGFTYPHLAR